MRRSAQYLAWTGVWCCLGLAWMTPGCGTPGATATAGAAMADQAPADQAPELSGTIHQDGGVLVFRPCHTRTQVPIAATGDHAALRAADAQWRRFPGDRLLVAVRGRIAVAAEAAAAEERETPHLIVERFLGAWPGETCGRPDAVAQLENMYWKLTRLEGQPVRLREGGREAHLVLHTIGRRLAGTSGCNDLSGVYELAGERLAFGAIATTKMMCPDLQEQEQALLAALTRVAAWRITGQHLELLDRDGVPLLRLEERALTQ
ncbi:MAG: META domain-containing protein [Candidatus Krumholzibacteria bacterium]|nr:META domain-containing protein [Candidatus Krumholzibacteria bacterium]